MKKFKWKYIYRCICFIIIVGCFLCVQNSSITKETKAINTNLNKNLNLNAMAKVIETFAMNDINTVLDTYNGTLTGYVANCPLCSGKLGCTGQNVLDGTTTYQDSTYGTVRIVASSTSLPCGSIVRFNNNTVSNTGVITAIVLDRGVTGTSLDLLVDSETTALTKVGSRNINYDILRFGWTRQNS
jgi:hypothetical protein